MISKLLKSYIDNDEQVIKRTDMTTIELLMTSHLIYFRFLRLQCNLIIVWDLVVINSLTRDIVIFTKFVNAQQWETE